MQQRRAARSPLAGKLYDETGDRLTPSHSNKNGRHLRYYISGRLVKDRSRKHPEAWRLPAQQLEDLLAETALQHLRRTDAAAVMTMGLQAAGLSEVAAALPEVLTPRNALAVIGRADISPGSLQVQLSAKLLAQALNISEDNLRPDELSIEAPFQMRRRGVEFKLNLGVAPPEIDRTLVRNIVKARRWLDMTIQGKSFAEIAEAEGTSKRRIQAAIELALLAPPVLDAIAAGEQPVGLTTEYLIRTGFQAIWSEQEKQFAGL